MREQIRRFLDDIPYDDPDKIMQGRWKESGYSSDF